jgi:cell division septum initiation protein DivIVA
MNRELSDLRDQVAKLEAELERIPQRNGSARDARQEAKEEEECLRQTAEALKLMEDFVP